MHKTDLFKVKTTKFRATYSLALPRLICVSDRMWDQQKILSEEYENNRIVKKIGNNILADNLLYFTKSF